MTNTPPSHQDRVNAELFRALEKFGQKLDRAQAENDILRKKLADLEHTVNTDPETGEMYLPIRVDPPKPKRASDHRYIYATTAMSLVFALIAIGISLTSRPPAIPADELLARHLPQFEDMAPQQSAWDPDSSSVTYGDPPKRHIRIVRVTPTAGDDTPVAEDISDNIARSEDQPPPQSTLDVAQMDQAENPASENPAQSSVPENTQEETIKTAAVENATPLQNRLDEKQTSPTQDNQENIASESTTPSEAPASPDLAKQENRDHDPELPEKFADIEQRALDGDAQAQHDLAVIYASGQSVDINFERAAHWFEKSAAGGIPNAHYNLGVMHHQGLGVEKDLNTALKWYKSAAKLDHPEAQYNLGIAYVEGVGAAQNIPLGLSYFEKAAAAGVAQAAYNLGLIYESDLLGNPDTDKAISWYFMAVDGGHNEAVDALTRLAGDDWANQNLAAQLGNLSPAAGPERITIADTEENETTDEEGSAIVQDNTPDRYLISQIQQILIAMNLLPGPPNGLDTPQTKDAIRAYQNRYGLKVDGQPSDDLLSHMVYDRGKAVDKDN